MRGWEHGPRGFEHFEWLGPLVMILLAAAIVVGIVLVVRALSSRHTPAAALAHGAGPVGVAVAPQSSAQTYVRPTAALTILEERFARGEIDRDEFHQRRHDLLLQAGYATQPATAPTPGGTSAPGGGAAAPTAPPMEPTDQAGASD